MNPFTSKITLFLAILCFAAGISAAECLSGSNCSQPPILLCDNASDCEAVEGTPYDLSGFSIPFPVTWPNEPQTSDTINVSNFSEFQTAVNRSNVIINVAPGEYVGNLVISSTDLDIRMSNSATLTGTISVSRGVRISWRGGNIVTPYDDNWQFRGAQDILLDDLHINGRIAFLGSLREERIAIINTTIIANTQTDFGLYMASGPRNEDVILANLKMDLDPSRPLNSDTSTLRIQQAERLVVVDSALNMEGRLSTGFRVGEYSDQVYVADTQIAGRIFHSYKEYNDVNVTNAFYDNVTRWIHPDAGSANLFASFTEGVPNTGQVQNSQIYSFRSNHEGATPNLGQFTTPPGATNPPVRAWSGLIADLPNVDSFGAQRQ